MVGALREKGFSGRIVWLGSKKDSDRAAVAAAGIEFIALPSGKLRRQLTLKNAADAFRVLAGYCAARRELKKLKPALLFSKGGYVSVPPCAAAASLGIPYFTHESDLTPGLATRLNAKRADRVVVSYEATRALLPEAARERAVVAGNPVRAEIRRGDRAKGRALLGLDKVPSLRDLPVIFFLGGSQGARQVNELAAETLGRLTEKAFVLHQGGPGSSPAIAGAPTGSDKRYTQVAERDPYNQLPPSQRAPARYRFYQYIREEMPDLIAAADLIVGRAGAGTLWESSALAKPMLLVPLCGSGTRGDQVDNAELFVRAGAAISLVGNEATADALVAQALGLVGDEKRLAAMGRAAAALAGRDAASEIADLILRRIGEAP